MLGARRPRDTELDAPNATVILRAIPLRPAGEHVGGLVLLRDVTELRRRDRELVTKDATIREIHHRVKNNLQTVAALLRLQARRIGVPEGRVALEEAVRRVGVDRGRPRDAVPVAFDERGGLRRGGRPAARDGHRRRGAAARRSARGASGSFGTVSSDVATPLAMVFTELIQNAAEHAFGDGPAGSVVVRCEREGERLVLCIEDDGVGLPVGFSLESSPSLGLSIVLTLVGELGGLLTPGRAARRTRHPGRWSTCLV